MSAVLKLFTRTKYEEIEGVNPTKENKDQKTKTEENATSVADVIFPKEETPLLSGPKYPSYSQSIKP